MKSLLPQMLCSLTRCWLGIRTNVLCNILYILLYCILSDCMCGHICVLYFLYLWGPQAKMIKALQSEDILMLYTSWRSFLRRWYCIVLHRTALEEVSQHGTVNMALGCSDRSQLSLQHLLSAGIYYLPQKPRQTDWTPATSGPRTLPLASLPPCFHWQPLAAGATGFANVCICISVLVNWLHCHCMSVVSEPPLTRLSSTVCIFPWGITAGQPVAIFCSAKPFHTPFFSLQTYSLYQDGLSWFSCGCQL